jgi:hypothetical protein
MSWLIPVGTDHAAIGYIQPKDAGLRVLDRYGRVHLLDVGDRRGQLKSAPNGQLMLRHQTGVTALDPSKNFAARELSIVDPGVPATWDVSFLDVLIDTRQDGLRWTWMRWRSWTQVTPDPPTPSSCLTAAGLQS